MAYDLNYSTLDMICTSGKRLIMLRVSP